MRRQWQEFREGIWSSRYDPIANHERRVSLIQAVLAIAIALAAGPEIFVATEMTAIMELLGAVLFLIAMSAGAKLVALSLWNSIRNVVSPIPLPALVRPGASILAKALAVACVVAHTTWSVAMTLNCRYVGPLDHAAGGLGE